MAYDTLTVQYLRPFFLIVLQGITRHNIYQKKYVLVLICLAFEYLLDICNYCIINIYNFISLMAYDTLTVQYLRPFFLIVLQGITTYIIILKEACFSINMFSS